MDEKHAFLVAIIVVLCLVCAITILWSLNIQAENAFLRQHLGIVNVTVGEGVQFTEDSWVLNAVERCRK